MKTLAATSIFALLTSVSAFAAPEKWQGTGAEYSPDGAQISTYTIENVVTELAPDKLQSEATIKFANGSQKTISQTLSIHGDSWKDDSSLGTGGGACYGGDTCENYLAGADGLSYATTIVHDDGNVQRNLTTVLKNGKPLKMIKESLSRVP